MGNHRVEPSLNRGDPTAKLRNRQGTRRLIEQRHLASQLTNLAPLFERIMDNADDERQGQKKNESQDPDDAAQTTPQPLVRLI